MDFWDHDGDEKREALIRFEGAPNQPDRPQEKARWRRFVGFLREKGGSIFRRAEDLGEAYAEARVTKENAEAEKFAAEAAEATARADQVRQETVRAVNEEITRIFSDDGLPDFARGLQLANLLTRNPEIIEQLDRIQEVYEHLHVLHGLRAALGTGKAVPEALKKATPEESSSADPDPTGM